MIKVALFKEKYDKFDERVTKIDDQPNTVENKKLYERKVREINYRC